MGSGYEFSNDNVYFRSRKSAAKYNDKIYSREGAAELLGISSSTLSDYELGLTKTIPPDMVVKMADLYNAPDLCNRYCNRECPIGSRLNISDEIPSLDRVVLRLLNVLDVDNINDIKKKLMSLAEDGKITQNEAEIVNDIEQRLSKVSKSISEVKPAGVKCNMSYYSMDFFGFKDLNEYALGFGAGKFAQDINQEV